MIKAIKNFFSNITKSSIGGAICIGGFIGWYLSVKFICEKSLEIYGTSSFYDVTNIIFGASLTIMLGVMLMLMFHLDFEGLLEHSKDDQTFGFVVPGRMDPKNNAKKKITTIHDKKNTSAIFLFRSVFIP